MSEKAKGIQPQPEPPAPEEKSKLTQPLDKNAIPPSINPGDDGKKLAP